MRVALGCPWPWSALWASIATLDGVYSLVVSVTDFGARPDDDTPAGLETCTAAFQKALSSVEAAGGGTVQVPAGVFNIRPLNLTSNLVLWLAAGARLKADTSVESIPLLEPLAAYGPPETLREAMRRARYVMRPQADLRDAIPRYQPLLYGVNLRNVTITGHNGTLDGQGVAWWSRWLSEPLYGRPHLVEFERSSGIVLRNITLRNPGFWSVHLWRCEYVEVQFVTILVTPWDPPVRPTNTDGVNPDSSSHVLIEDTYLQTGDDAIAIKSGWDCYGRRYGVTSRNITIRRVAVRQTRGCNAAAITVGSEMSAGVEDVLIEDCDIIYAGVGVEVKVGTGRGGFVRRVVARNLRVQETSRGALVVAAVYPEQNPFCTEINPPAPTVSGIVFERIQVIGPTFGKLVQLQGTPQVPLRNVSVTGLRGSGEWLCELVSGRATDNRPRSCPLLPAEDLPAEPASWRNDGRCGKDFLEGRGRPGRCPTPEEFADEAGKPSRAAAEPWLSSAPCCGASGWCGNAVEHCQCDTCVNFQRLAQQRRPAMEESPVPQARRPVANFWDTHISQTPRPAADLWEPRPYMEPQNAEAQVPAADLWEPRPHVENAVPSRVSHDELPSAGSGDHVPVEPPAQGLIMSCMLGLCAMLFAILARHSNQTLLSWKSGACCAMLACVGSVQLLMWYQPREVEIKQPQEATEEMPRRTLERPFAMAAGPGRPFAEGGSSSSSSGGGDQLHARRPCMPGVVGPMTFGAVGDGYSDDTQAVWNALAYGSRCGTVVVIGPKGYFFRVSPNGLQVKLEHLTVRFEGELLGPSLQAWNPHLESWPRGSCAYAEADCSSHGSRRSPEFARSHWSLLHLKDSFNVTLQGPGGLRAPGRTFWSVRNHQPAVRGYCLVKVDRSRRISISGLALTDSPMYQVVIMESRDIALKGLVIKVSDTALGNDGAHNTDGVTIISSEAVTLRDSLIESGDDNVAIKEGSRGIVVEDVRIHRGKGISIGSLGEAGTKGQMVTDVLFDRVSLQHSVHGARIKTWQGGRGLVRNVTFQSFHVQSVFVGILIDQTYCPRSQRPEGCEDGSNAAISIEDVHFKGFKGSVTQEERQVMCVRCTGLTFEDINLIRLPGL